MKRGDHPRGFLLLINRVVKDLERVGCCVDPKDIGAVSFSRLTSQYDAKALILEPSSDRTTQDLIERAVINQFNRLEAEKSAAGAKALTVTRGSSHNHGSTETCALCWRAGHNAATCRHYLIATTCPTRAGKAGTGAEMAMQTVAAAAPTTDE